MGSDRRPKLTLLEMCIAKRLVVEELYRGEKEPRWGTDEENRLKVIRDKLAKLIAIKKTGDTRMRGGIMDNESLGKEAYAAYGRTVDFKNYEGKPMPEWGNLTEKIRLAWMEAAARVRECVLGQREAGE